MKIKHKGLKLYPELGKHLGTRIVQLIVVTVSLLIQNGIRPGVNVI
jgi:hypothetical protein